MFRLLSLLALTACVTNTPPAPEPPPATEPVSAPTAPHFPGLGLPTGTGTAYTEADRVLVVLSKTSLSVGGTPVLRLEEGTLPKEPLAGQLITPLYDALESVTSRRMLLATHPELSFDDAKRVMYTVGQRKITDFDIAVQQDSSPVGLLSLRLPQVGADSPPPAGTLSVQLGTDGYKVIHGETTTPLPCKASPCSAADFDHAGLKTAAQATSGPAILAVQDAATMQMLVDAGLVLADGHDPVFIAGGQPQPGSTGEVLNASP